MRSGAFPGSFDPPTIAHLAIAHAAVDAARLDRLDFVLSRVALGKENRGEADSRAATLEQLATTRPWLGVRITDDQLIVDIARGYDVVVMGADKWTEVRDPAWYGSAAARDDALARLPRVLVVPRSGIAIEAAEVLDLADDLDHVSSTAARAGAQVLVAPELRSRLLVDVMNVIGSRPDGWWKDRDGAARRLIRSLQARARRTGERIAAVLDGRALPDLPEGVHDGVLVAYATRRGRDAADDRIVSEVERDRDPASLTVVTSDRRLRERVQALGAQVAPASSVIDRGSASR
ncbi:MAG: NYN domain-containing protein [Actinomycetota bacterium]